MRRRFKILIAVMLVAIIALVCAIGLVWSDIQKLKAVLDNLYWIRKTTHSGGVRIAIEWVEARLQQKQTVLTSLIVVTTVLAMASLITILRHTLIRVVKDTRRFKIAFVILLVVTIVWA